MGAASGADERGGNRTPRLAPDCDPTSLRLTPTEGYLLSRVDGSTSWSLLREIGGLPGPEVDRLLEQWLKAGVLVIDGEDPASDAAPAGAGIEALPPARIDAQLDIAVEIQREILAFEERLTQPYHEILGVPSDAGTPRIKKAYFTLSKKFHPDRYFRKNLGPFEVRVERIFKKVLEAYELLSDPMTRAEVQRSLETAPASEAPSGSGTAARKPKRRIAENLSLLAQHKRHLEERRRKAKNLFESGIAAFRAERWLEAARGVRLAMAFDPRNDAFRESFSDVQRRAHEEQAKILIKQADEAFDLSDYADAERLYEEAMHFRPFDASLCMKVARLAWQASGDLRKAKECASSGCELEPENASYRLMLGRIYKAAGLKANARRELETAMRLDPVNTREAKSEIRSL